MALTRDFKETVDPVNLANTRDHFDAATGFSGPYCGFFHSSL